MQDRERFIQTLLSNDRFVQWVQSPTGQSDAYWQQWMLQSYERKEIVEEARKIILTLNFETVDLSESQKILLKKRIKQSVGNRKPHEAELRVKRERTAPSQKRYILLRTLKYAAAIATIILAGALYFADNLDNDEKIMQMTAYGETSSFVLPDGSTVMLNANSSLEYWPGWDTHATREVWLQGEAFFSIEQIRKPVTSSDISEEDSLKVKFIVHTNNLDIEVVGTQFNVRSRRGDTEVTLNSGKVKLNSSQTRVVSNVIMNPGDQAQLSAKNDFGIKTVNPETYSSWRKDLLVFNDMTLEEIGQIIEDNYGYQVTIVDEILKKTRVNTNLSQANVEKFCNKLEEMVSGLEIVLEKNQIIMKTK